MYKTAIETAILLLRIDDIVSGSKKRGADDAGPAVNHAADPGMMGWIVIVMFRSCLTPSNVLITPNHQMLVKQELILKRLDLILAYSFQITKYESFDPRAVLWWITQTADRHNCWQHVVHRLQPNNPVSQEMALACPFISVVVFGANNVQN